MVEQNLIDERIAELDELGFQYDEELECFTFGPFSVLKYDLVNLDEENWKLQLMDIINLINE